MKKMIKSPWFWLMNIFWILLVIALIDCQLFEILGLLKQEVFWVAVGSLATIISVCTAASTYHSSENIRKKKATYDAYDHFKNDSFMLECEIYSYNLEEILESKKKNDDEEKNAQIQSDDDTTEKSKEWQKIKEYLARVERIAVCVNNQILDIDVIYNMGGPFMIEMFERLEDIIRYKRKKDNREGIYEEFEIMVKSLRKIGNSHHSR